MVTQDASGQDVAHVDNMHDQCLADVQTSTQHMVPHDCRAAQRQLRWDKYKHDLVQGILWGTGRQDRLLEYTSAVKKMNGSNTWR